MRLMAPAKINLYLRITGRRPDGYHLLDSLMVPISLSDELELTAERGERDITLTCDDSSLPTDETNLAYKAAVLFCREANVQARVTMILHKRIPAGAGLGGGSSDAAAVLKGLNTLLAVELSEQRLCELAVRLGADVPFFIPCRPAQVTGIGEVLTPVPPLPLRWIVLIVPSFGVSTPWAYRRFDELVAKGAPMEERGDLPAGQWPAPSQLRNDLELAVLPAHPEIGRIKDRLLRTGADGALMSGSGSSVFGVFQDRARAERAVDALGEHGRSFLVTPLRTASSV